ncbi:MAG: electron transport complex subunit RsxE [Candidatus Marinimicrobia bacterium]|nr:electron transport complex subunit RsxE [Candidatus Neomarinimicrobiota bacterium]
MADTAKKIFIKGLWEENPIFRQVLGVCSTLAVTNLLVNTLFMCFGVMFTTALSSLTISILRNYIPRRIRMIVQVLIIASYVMMVDIIIKALNPDIHRFIGPYVGLIITNCIIMGRAEAFASQNRPWSSFIDGIASGLGYSLILVAIALIREPLGFGTILGYVLPAREVWWHQWTIMVMPPGAFFMLAIATWIGRNLSPATPKRQG